MDLLRELLYRNYYGGFLGSSLQTETNFSLAKPETLYQRILAFVEDNLLTVESGIEHRGEEPAEDEDMSPMVENMIIVTWLRCLHPGLPALVKERYGTELRNSTLASIKPEISQALNSLLQSLSSTEENKITRSGS